MESMSTAHGVHGKVWGSVKYSKVLNLNRPFKNMLGQFNNVLLNELGKFYYLETWHLHGHGAGESSTHTKERANQKKSTNLNVSWRKSDPYYL